MSNSKSLRSVFSYQSWVHAVAGATGSVVAMSTFFPLDTVRMRLQLEDHKNRKSVSTFDVIKQLVDEEGVGTLYRGLVPVLESLCISNFVYFYTFHSLKAAQAVTSQTALRDLMLGALAGVVNVLTTTPCWVVNTRLKMNGIRAADTKDVDKPKSELQYTNLIDGLVYVGKTEGIAGLWAGTVPSLMLVLNPALQFMTYEAIKRHLTRTYGSDLPGLAFFAAGALAKTLATVLTYPLQLIQVKLRHGAKDGSSSLPSDAGTLAMLLHILKKQGVRGLFRGLEAKILQTVLTAALMFATYEKIAKFVMSLMLRKPVLT